MLNRSSDRSYRSPSMVVSTFASLSGSLSLLKYHFVCWVLSHPLPLSFIFAFVRRARPVAMLGKMVVVTKAMDVRDVLDRLEDFTTADVLGPKMPWGPFMIGIDWPEQHTLERTFLQNVVSGKNDATKIRDVERIRDEAAAKCRTALEKAKSSVPGRAKIDVVTELSEPVVVHVIESYFGIPVIGTPQDMARILGQAAAFVMMEPPPGSERRTKSLESIATLTQCIVKRIDQIPASKTRSIAPDLLTRLVTQYRSGRRSNPDWFDEDWIRRYITGLAVFGGGTIVRAATQAIDRLVAHPEVLPQAQELAQQLERNPPDCEAMKSSQSAWHKLRQIIYEALRFRPMLPLLVRYAPRETMIAKGSSHARLVPAGATVLAPPIAAMFDPEEFPNPWRFKLELPDQADRRSNKYMHFGPEGQPHRNRKDGPRICFGRYVADVLIVEVVRALLLCEELRRAPGASGRIVYDGPVPRSLTVTFKS
jgi:cytochrome P450